ncbi:acyl-CoA dehydrogenase family protein [Subtercola endophyticus]|uniref:acyl-CoA dehydrogenase family protein n=1 Tax=Subtercola endophyticus TaxID=2895559 RepID=UPI001E3FBA23|nr:acyl-CoA dehydrogenase family protein [Subtercola endophyticus]UFS58157.1 acyl-CoA dehydrogenase family protein [Subtercola endophyticus]
MLDFSFSEDHEEFQKTLSTFARRELLPGYTARSASSEFPFALLKKIGDLGVLGIGLPERFGGTGEDDPVLLGIASEALAYGDVNLASAPIQVGLVGAQLLHGTEEVQQRYLPPVIAGEENLAIALTEPESGSDASALRTTARRVAGGWLLNGEKTAISWAMSASAALIYAREEGTTRSSGVSCFVVDLASEGVAVRHMIGMGCLPLGWGSITLDGVFVPDSHLIGEEGRGFQVAMNHFDFSRAAIGLMCLGAAEQSLEEAALYATQRSTFGKPISEYQGVSFPLAEQATYIEGARWVCYRALWLRQQDRPHTSLASMSKWWAPVVAKDAIEASMKIHGNLGYSAEFPLQQRFRDVMAYLVADGTAEIQKGIISKEILARKTVSL